MTTPHKHAELIKAWADGATIQYWDMLYGGWKDFEIGQPTWSPTAQYRVKPTESKKVKMWNALYKSGTNYMCSDFFYTTEKEAKRDWVTGFIKLLPHTEIEIEISE